MFFNEEEMKVAENLAWKMLDGWNHAYMPNLDDYAHFYYKDQVIFDPWMNEKGQELPWPDHESKEYAVNPIEYYDIGTIQNFVKQLFLKRPEWAPEITEKIQNPPEEPSIEIDQNDYFWGSMPIEVFIAMTEEQAEEENYVRCLGIPLPNSRQIYDEMCKLPSDLVQVVKDGWEREICFRKKDAKKILKLLYPNKKPDFDLMKYVNRVHGDVVYMIGFGD